MIEFQDALDNLAPTISQKELDSRNGMIYMRLAQLWMLADYLGDTKCKNNVMDKLVAEDQAYDMPALWCKRFCEEVYAKTTPASGLRKWLVDHILPDMTCDLLERNIQNFPHELVTDLFKAFMAQKGRVQHKNILKGSGASKYHE